MKQPERLGNGIHVPGAKQAEMRTGKNRHKS